jgi:hypothetical protein
MALKPLSPQKRWAAGGLDSNELNEEPIMPHARPRLLFAIATLALCVLAGPAGAKPGTNNAKREYVNEVKATIDSVDLNTREVVITTEDGKTTRFTAGPEVRNLDRVHAGDSMTVTYYETVQVSLASATDPLETTTARNSARSPAGAQPRAEAAVAGDLVVEFVSYDRHTGVAKFVTGDGTVETAVVQPEMRDFAAARKKGDRVRIKFGQAVAIAVSPSTN